MKPSNQAIERNGVPNSQDGERRGDNPQGEMSERSTWLMQLSDTSRDDVIICLPYAGMGSSVFGGWRNSVLESADIYAVQLPGRDGRLREPPINHADPLVGQLADAIITSPLADRPITLLGCSFGAILAFELARRLRERGKPIQRLVAAACRPPHNLGVTESVALLEDKEMVHKLQHWYGAIPPEVANNPTMLELVLPAIRGDMQVYETYPYRDEEPLDCPIIAVGGSEDRIVDLNHLNAWRKETSAKFLCRQFAGDHFFMKKQFSPVLRFIDRQIRSTAK